MTDVHDLVADWFEASPPTLFAQECKQCGTLAFPPTRSVCAAPDCQSDDLRRTPLSRQATVWSFTTNRYRPPPPYRTSDPYEPEIVLAATLPEGITVLGKLNGPDDGLSVGASVELTAGPLEEEGTGAGCLIWQWRLAKVAR